MNEKRNILVTCGLGLKDYLQDEITTLGLEIISSHVGGVITGFSSETNPIGKYTCIAPEANILSVRIADDAGNATGGDLMAGLEYVDDNRDAYNIRVLNLSVSSSIA